MEYFLRTLGEDFNIFRDLFLKEKKEQFGFLLCEKLEPKPKNILYIAREIILPDEHDMNIHNAGMVEPDKMFQLEVYRLAIEKGYAIFDLHNHWFQNKPCFSSIDMDFAKENARFISRYLPGVDFGFVVFNSRADAYSGLVYDAKSKDFKPLNSIEITGSPTSILYNDLVKEVEQIAGKYSRHSLIPGWKQHVLPDLNVAIIGAGGTGSHIIQALACMGVGEGRGSLIIVDPDTIEESNLSRIPYASPKDIGKLKVNVAKRYVRSKNPGIKVYAIAKSVQDPEVRKLLLQAHVMFGDVDSDGARKIIMQTSHEALIPYIDIGTEIMPEQEKYHAGGQVRVILPRQGCLFCIGGIDLSEAAKDLITDEQAKDMERAGYIRGTSQSPTPSVIHLNGVASYLAISQFIKIVFGEKLEGQKAVYYDQQKMSLLPVDFAPSKNCPLCGEMPTEQETQELMNGLQSKIVKALPEASLSENHEEAEELRKGE